MKLFRTSNHYFVYSYIGIFNLFLITSIFWFLSGRNNSILSESPGIGNFLANVIGAVAASVLWDKFVWVNATNFSRSITSVLIVLVLQILGSLGISFLASESSFSPMIIFALVTPLVIFVNFFLQQKIRT